MLDERLIDFAFSLPPEHKLRGRMSKALLKDVAEEFLPQSVVHRRKKGFAIPLAAWAQRSTARPDSRRDRGRRYSGTADFSAAETFRAWLDEHESNRCDRSKPLWALLSIPLE
jgi:asparagine synthase (glutamine-hydrolysing)